MGERGVTATSEPTARVATGGNRGGFGSLGSIVYLLALTWAAAIASFPLNDNSFFTHLSTGRIILERGEVPSADPYTFTAFGEPWTVQSWLASVAYAGFERLGGDVGLRVLVLAVFAAAMSVLWRLTRPATSIVARFLLLSGALFVVTDLWSERPYMIGVIGLGLVWLALEGEFRPVLLLPFMWVWVNSHGSFPLAAVLVAAFIAGSALDRRSLGSSMRPTESERRTAGAVVIGSLLGAVSPVGLKLLWFPLSALSKGATFAEIIEWQPPDYRSVGERAYLVFAVASILLLVHRRSWRLALPAVMFAAAGLYAQRNIVMATVVLLAVCARCSPRIGTLVSDDRPRIGVAVASLFAVLLLTVSAFALASPAVSPASLGGYPARAVALVGEVDRSSSRMATEASTGNLLHALDGARAAVFVDDRVDMFPEGVFRDSLRLARGEPGWQTVVDQYGIEVVLWRRASPIGSLLAADAGWRIAYSDESSVIACRRGRPCPVVGASSP